MNQEILELTANINTINDALILPTIIAISSLFFSIILFAFISCYIDNNNRKQLLFFIIPVILIIFGVYLMFDVKSQGSDLVELKEQRETMFKSEIDAMTCIDLRILLLEIMDGKHDSYMTQKQDWIRDYYFVDCETPLRDEILKLRNGL